MNKKQITLFSLILIAMISNPLSAVIVSGGSYFAGDKKLALVGTIPANIYDQTGPFSQQFSKNHAWLYNLLRRLSAQQEPIQVILEGDKQTLIDAQKEVGCSPALHLGILPTIIQHAQSCAGCMGPIRFIYGDHQGARMRLLRALCNLIQNSPELLVPGIPKLKQLYGDCTIQELFNELDTAKKELAQYVDTLTPTSHGHQIFSAYLASLNQGIKNTRQLFTEYVDPSKNASTSLIDIIFRQILENPQTASKLGKCHSMLSKSIISAGIFRALDNSFRAGYNTLFIGSFYQTQLLLQALESPHEASIAPDTPSGQPLTDDELRGLRKSVIKAYSSPESLCCATCKKVAPKMKCCGRCLKKYYCSENCQRADWPNHKKTCQQRS